MTYRMLFVASSIQPLGHRMDSNNKTAMFQLPSSQSDNNDDDGVGGGGIDNYNDSNNDSNFELNLSDAEKADIIRMHNSSHLYNKLGRK